MPQKNKPCDHFSVFAIYLKYNEEDCKKEMGEYFKGLKTDTEKTIDIRLKRWWEEDTTPQGAKFHTDINKFFRQLAKKPEINKEWNDQWIKTSIGILEYKDTGIKDAVIKFKQPNAISRFHNQLYGNQEVEKESFSDIIDRYCHHFFYIYRLRSIDGCLVRDLLRIRGHRKGDIFCNLYQYTSYKIKGQKHKEWNNIKRFNGNLFFNHNCLNFTFVAPDIQKPFGLECSHMMMERMSLNTECWGYMLGIKDKDLIPMVDTLLIVEADDISRKNFDVEKDMDKYVHPLKDKKYQEIKERIKEEIISVTNKRFEARKISNNVIYINKNPLT